MKKEIPNLLTLANLLAGCLGIYFVMQGNLIGASYCIFISLICDFLDGFLAKRNNWRSELGAMLDPTADKLLLVSLFITLYKMNLIPYWLTVSVIMRDAMIIFGLSLYRYFIGNQN